VDHYGSYYVEGGYDSLMVPGAAALKPCVVFHGGAIEQSVVELSLKHAASAASVLLVGSTATTFSAFRLVRDVAQRGGTVGILNRGATRADPLATFKLEEEVGAALQAAAAQLWRERNDRAGGEGPLAGGAGAQGGQLQGAQAAAQLS
jgi:NAD-dependent SIR2 family protein deacetylase